MRRISAAEQEVKSTCFWRLFVPGVDGNVLLGEAGAASVRRGKGLPHARQTVLAGSKIDPPLAKAGPNSQDGNISGITYLRLGKKLLLCGSGEE